jgi:hypothetical protein
MRNVRDWSITLRERAAPAALLVTFAFIVSLNRRNQTEWNTEIIPSGCLELQCPGQSESKRPTAATRVNSSCDLGQRSVPWVSLA